ncbi:MAG TPA: sigma-70 family RNA polymerase sigma factor [Thermoanaerobaculia bacterium]|nr:sigma-70 family RNA polymerase sigma factor [Thermoanaerobaculia bacterium]
MTNPEEIYRQNLHKIRGIAASVARRNWLNPEESADFVQEVCLRLIDDDYAAIRKFEGRSELTTYLTTVIKRLYQTYRVEQWGKWRPSAEAKRLGEKAITLERLMSRDGHTFHEAVQILTTPADSPYTAAELEAIYVRLPPRMPRPVVVAHDDVPDAIAVEAEDRMESRERECVTRNVVAYVDRFIESLDAEDRLILRLRFWHGLKVCDIAERCHLEPRKLYKHFGALLLRMRRSLEQAGFTETDISTILCHGDQEIRFESLRETEKPSSGPSHPSDGEGPRGREGGRR